jgi:DNA-binding LacI/PurR family transcriptional regulator
MTKRVTSHDIAARAGVSRTTVSFVLNNTVGTNISSETRKRVLSAASEMGYVPNSAARMLVSGRSHTLGLVLSNGNLVQVDAFIPALIFGITNVCNSRGYKVLVESIEQTGSANPYIDLAQSKRIDALIVINPQVGDLGLRELIKLQFPLVIFGSLDDPNENSVSTPACDAAAEATQHLLKLGHRKIAHISYAPFTFCGAVDRLAGYSHALRSSGLRIDNRLVVEGAFDSESGFQAMKKLLARKTLPTALFAGNDTVAIGAMAAIRDAGLRVPEDIAVVGFDDLPFAAYVNPRLTTVRSHAAEQGAYAARAAIELLDGAHIGIKRNIVPLELVVRESCGSPIRRCEASPERSNLPESSYPL